MSLIYKPLEELSDEEWGKAHEAFYSPELTAEMGGIPQEPVPLQEFYNTTMDSIENGSLVAWAIIKDDEYLGHMLLVNGSGEWEIGVALVDENRWGSGVGIRAGLYALRFAFEELGAQQVIAFALGRNPNNKAQFERIGFRPFLNFLMMPIEVYDSKWRDRLAPKTPKSGEEE